MAKIKRERLDRKTGSGGGSTNEGALPMIARVSTLTRYKAEFKDAEFERLANDTKPLDYLLPHDAQIASTGLIISSKIERHQWEELGTNLANVYTGVQWAVGDWMAFGEHRFGLSKDAIRKIAKEVGYTVDSLMNLAWVSRQVDHSLRNEKLSHSHHVAVAKLEREQQREFLNKAEENNWSVTKLRQYIAKSGEDVPSSELRGEQAVRRWLEDFEKWAAEQPRFSRFLSDIGKPPVDLEDIDDEDLERLVEVTDGAAQRWGTWSKQLRKFQRDRDHLRNQQAAE